MFVRMAVQITGTRNGIDWPRIGELIELPDLEAADMIAAGYCIAVDEPAPEIVVAPLGRKARK